MIPSVMRLKARIFDFLTGCTELMQLTNVGIAHPGQATDLKNGKGYIAITQLYDGLEGRYLTRSLLYPWLQFACWHTTEPRATLLLERLINWIEKWQPADFSTDDQRVNFINRRNRSGPLYDPKTQLFVSSVDIGFNLSNLDKEH